MLDRFSRHARQADGTAGLEAVIVRAAFDAEFRRQLLADARAAIAETFGVALPPTLRLRFVERDPDVQLMIVLPDLVDLDGLGESDLQMVTGGVAEAIASLAAWRWSRP